ncbi:AAA domain-containing protein [Lachnospiraceae bacterium NK3A20]|jgi:pilus assembly protein CpaE|nr:AAA domain-containing protein [Lachnospiraceae bacterium NK3A20]
MINILVAGKYSDSIQKITDFARDLPNELKIVGTAEDDQTALEGIDSQSPDVVVITQDGGDSDLVQIARKIYVYKPRIITVVYGHNMDSRQFTQLIASGVRYAGEYPKEADEFVSSLRKLIEVESTRAGYIGQQRSTLLTSSSIVGFYSPKAGVGTTTCAVNTAVALAKRGRKVIIVDLDLEFGDAASFLDLKPKKTISDLCAENEKESFSISDIESYAELHPSGVYVLAAPKSPEFAENVTTERIQSIFATLKIYFEYIIVDLPAGLASKHAELFNMMNRIYLVTQLQLSSVTAAKQAVNILGVLGRRENVNVIVNRHSKLDLITIRDLHKIINCRIVASIPSDYRIAISAANRGLPVISGFPRSTISRAFRNIAAYTDSKNTDLDIWDMSAGEIAREYQKFDAGLGSADTGKKLELLHLGKSRREINGGTA